MATWQIRGRLAEQARVGITKVPQITAWFWIAKVASTGMGEAFSDYLYLRLGTFESGAIGAVLLIGALAWQFSVKRYRGRRWPLPWPSRRFPAARW